MQDVYQSKSTKAHHFNTIHLERMNAWSYFFQTDYISQIHEDASAIMLMMLTDFTLHSLRPFCTLIVQFLLRHYILWFKCTMGEQETCENWRPFENLNGDCTQTVNVGAQKSQKARLIIKYPSSFVSHESRPRQKDKMSYLTLSIPNTNIQWTTLFEE